jgi:hypothetical protein
MSLYDAQFKRVSIRNALQLAGLCFVLLLCLPAHSQTLGRISGIVTDSSGGAVAGATVTVTDVSRGIPRTLTTDSTGTYSAPNLIPGAYSVHATNAGFKTFDRQDIQVGVGADVHVDVTLQPGEQTQTITVTGEIPAITTTNAQLSATIDANALSDLPIAGHNYIQLLALLPTFQLRQGSATGPSQYSNGLRAEYNIYVLDGVTDSETYYTGLAINTGYSAGGPEQAVLLPTDAIQEFNVVENAKAEYGWRPGAQVNIAIKSGQNSMHGTAFASGRSTGLTNKNAFATFKPPVSFEDFDASIGGAIKKDKLFYLAGYEGQRYSVGNPRTSTEPTLATGAGLTATNSIPLAIVADGTAGVLNPIMTKLAGCTTTVAQPISVSQVTCTPGAGLFTNNGQGVLFPVAYPAFGKTDNGVGRLDYHLNDHHNISGEFFDGDGFAATALTAAQPYWSTPFEVHTRVARAWWTWVPNSNWVNDARFGWDNILISNTGSYDCATNPVPTGGVVDNQWVPGAGAPNYATAFGFVSGGLPQCGSGNNSAFPTITISGFTTSAQAATLGGAAGSFDTSGIERWLDSVSWTHGNHITKFGGEFALAHGTPVLNVQNSKGTLNFNNNVAALNSFAGATPLDNFMAGAVTSTSIQIGTVPRQFTFKQFAGYIQDDWRIFPRLTVNLGLRYEYTGTIHEANNLLGNLALGSASGVRQQGQGGALYTLSPWGFAPRFGIAWDVTGKGTTVARAGFNIAYQNPTIQAFITPGMNTVPTAAAFVSNGVTVIPSNTAGTINTANLPAFNPASLGVATIGNGANYATTGFFGNVGLPATLTCSDTIPCAFGGAATHLLMPEVLNWSFGIQHAITNTITLDANYVGTHGQHLFDSTDINQAVPNAASVANSGAENKSRPFNNTCAFCAGAPGPYPWFSQIKELQTIARSNYNALQMILRKRAGHGLTLLATYTYSHALDVQSSDLNPVLPQDGRNLAADYGNSSFDLRHHFAVGPSYMLPGKSGYWQMLQGWQVTTTASVFSGRPNNPIDAADDISGTGEGQDRWNLVGKASDFSGWGTASSIPCFDANLGTTSATWKNACAAGLPTICTAGLGAAQTAEVQKLGCYVIGNSALIPSAPGTFGTMGRYQVYSVGTWEWDMSIVKSWHIKERFNTQFRADIYNVTNSTFFAAPSVTLSSPSTFGQSASTPDTSSPFVGTGGPRKIQLGLKILF